MKDHSIVRIHFSTGLILMKLNRPMWKKEKGQNLVNFKISWCFFHTEHETKPFFSKPSFLNETIFSSYHGLIFKIYIKPDVMPLSLRLCFSGQPVWNLILEFRFFGKEGVLFFLVNPPGEKPQSVFRSDFWSGKLFPVGQPVIINMPMGNDIMAPK